MERGGGVKTERQKSVLGEKNPERVHRPQLGNEEERKTRYGKEKKGQLPCPEGADEK